MMNEQRKLQVLVWCPYLLPMVKKFCKTKGIKY